MSPQKITGVMGTLLVAWVAPALTQVFTSPLIPPETHYVIDAKLDTAKGLLAGAGSVTVRNVSQHELRSIAFQWSGSRAAPFELTIGGSRRDYASKNEPIEVVLPAPLRPGAKLELAFRFRRPTGQLDSGWRTQQWFPRLWWGYETHASYDIGIEAPPNVVVGASAGRDTSTGRYHADHIRSFGLFFARGYQLLEVTAGRTRVRSIFRSNMQDCAELVLRTAADAISFYRERFGMYPQPILTIIPGVSEPWGGEPFATAMIVVHGQQACSEKPRDTHWRWIAAHEVAHQYWIEHVLAKEPEQGYGWLMIGLGIWTDREYARTHGLAAVHADLLERYTKAAREGLKTDTHAKGFGIVSALAAVVGHDTFLRVYQRALHEYTGRRLGMSEFRRIAEEESGQDLGRFFATLLRTNKFPSYGN